MDIDEEFLVEDQMSATIEAKSTSPIQEYLEKGHYEKAFDEVDVFLLGELDDPQEFASICGHIEILIPNLSKQEQERLLQLACRKISQFPGLKEQQIRILELYGELFLEEQPATAIRSISTALALGGETLLHKTLSKSFLLIFLKVFKIQLQRTCGKSDPSSFQRLLEIWSKKFSQEPEAVQQLFTIARNVRRDLPELTRMRFNHLLPWIREKEKQVISLDKQEFLTQEYYLKLEKMRACFLEEGEVRVIQRERAAKIREFFQMLFEDALFILGEPPCLYQIRVMGSLAREEMCPYSNLEYFILIEDVAQKPYFQKLAKIFDLQILALGETDPRHQGLFDFGQKFGLEIDPQGNPALDDSLIGTAEQLFAPPVWPEKNKLIYYKSILRSVFLHGDLSFEIPQGNFTEYAKELLEMRKVEFENLQILRGEICSVKEEFMQPLVFFLKELGFFYGIKELNTIDLIEQLPIYSPSSKKLLQESVSDLYTLRIRLHLESRSVQEEASLVPSLELPVLKAKEKEALQKMHLLVLQPLYQVEIGEDFLAQLFSHSNKFLIDRYFENFAEYSQW